MKLYIVLAVLVSMAFADELSDCKCLEGYHALLDENGVAMCYGIHVKALAPCNLRKKPRCRCGPEVTGILNDASGVWCVTYNRGRQVKRWRCENGAEWDTFYGQHQRQPFVGSNEENIGPS